MSVVSELEILQKGDINGDWTVIQLRTRNGTRIRSVAVPQGWESRTGPTWVYLVEVEGGLTLIDAGSHGTFEALAQGLKQLKLQPRDLDRIIVTHGHADHDGGVFDLANASHAELWAHDLYAHLLPYDRWTVEGAINPLLKSLPNAESHQWGIQNQQAPNARFTMHRQYREQRLRYQVDRLLRDGDEIGDLKILYAPGHSPDEICIALDDVLFTGDHVLPEITPHPTTKSLYPETLRAKLPEIYRHEGNHYGLRAYIASLNRVREMHPETLVLPAHRLLNKGRWNLETVARAGGILQHHLRRMGRLVKRMSTEGNTLEELTRGEFRHAKLLHGNLFAAATEIVSHIEFLEDAGDVEITPEQKIIWKGTSHYREVAKAL